MSDSLRPYGLPPARSVCPWDSGLPPARSVCPWDSGLPPARFVCPWDSPGKNTRVDCQCLPPGDLPDPGIEPESLCLLHCRPILYPLSHLGSPFYPEIHSLLSGVSGVQRAILQFNLISQATLGKPPNSLCFNFLI